MSAAPADLERAVQLLRAKQHAYYIQAVRNALQSEEQRKRKLLHVATHLESKRLEKQFAKERACDRERLQQIQDDHTLLLRAKVADWREHGVPAPALLSDSTSGAASNTDATARGQVADSDGLVLKQQHKQRKASKAALSRLATPRVTVQKAGDEHHESASMTGACGSSQDVQFLTAVYRKHDRERLYRAESLPVLTSETLRAMSETDLLHKKVALLQQLHGVISQQERIVQDDACTVRSSVSSWKSSSSDVRSTTSTSTTPATLS